MSYDKDNIAFQPIPTVHNFKNLVGHVFGRLTVLGYAGTNPSGTATWFCQCECGAVTKSNGAALRRGATQSCGCLRNEWHASNNARLFTTHNATKSPEYQTYRDAKKRCTSKKSKCFQNYGGRGIQFLFTSFEAFLNEVGPRPARNYTLERIDNDGDYAPGNVRWATRSDQARNKRSTLQVTYQGRTQPLAAWCEELGITYDFAYNRLHRGWTPDEAFTVPFMTKRPRTP